MSDQNQILRLLGTIREECADIRSRQEELYELLLGYKDQLHGLQKQVEEKLSGLPKSPYIAGQLVPAPEKVDGIDDLRQLLATYLHRYDPANELETKPTDARFDPPPEVKPEDVELEPSEDRPRKKKKGGGGSRRPRDMDLERGPDRDIEPIDLDDDSDEKPKRKRRRRSRKRGGRKDSEQEAVSEKED